MVQKKVKVSDQWVPAQTPGEPRRSERRERRSPLCLLLLVWGFSAGGRIFSEHAATLNISRSGCCVRLQTRPLEDTVLALQIVPHGVPLPVPQTPVLYHIAWLQQQENSWEVGLHALGDSDLLRLAFALYTP